MDNFNVLTNDQFPEKNKRSLPIAKIVFAVLGVILLTEVVYAVKVLTSPAPPPLPPVSNAVVKPVVGQISLSAPKTIYKVNEVVPVIVRVDTGSHEVSGVDLIIRFDPKTLEASSGGLVKGSILDEYPLISLDADKGLISISGISNAKEGFKGVGQFATINFRAKKVGQSALTIDFQKDSTVDSNLVETGISKDILEQVNNLELNIE